MPDLGLVDGQELNWLASIFSLSVTGLEVQWSPVPAAVAP